jgi:carbon storage regulator
LSKRSDDYILQTLCRGFENQIDTDTGKHMLILMRRAGESIYVGPNIVITLVSLERNRARIGIQAPREITVDREEIAKRKQSGAPPPAPLGDDSEEDDEDR